MEKFTNTITKKLLIIIITIVMLTNFIMPNYVQADNEFSKAGGQLVSGFFELLTYFGDAGLAAMQRMMKGTWEIQEYGKYRIKYSPGMIFANEVPALDINFIKANKGDGETLTFDIQDVSNKDEMCTLLNKITENNIQKSFVEEGSLDQKGVGVEKKPVGKQGLQVMNGQFYGPSGYCLHVRKIVFNNWSGVADKYVDPFLSNSNITDAVFFVSDGDLYLLEAEDALLSSYTISKYDLSTINEKREVFNESTAGQLKEGIAKWYIGLRTIALVGLLSVLVYLGIVIILNSSSAQNQAKYKAILKDWLVAICILFMLHYAMTFMLNMTERISEICKNNVLGETTQLTGDGNKYDILMSTIRENVGKYAELSEGFNTAANAIMYLALVILTGIFTFQYLRRVIYMAFLTMVAPLIALTYPIDKVRDGKAQAFSFWLREYIFNCLIQPVHLLLYNILIVNAFDFAKENVLYAIVALAFLVPAEKFVKEMFGMKSQSPVGTLGAAAGGAMVMSMLQKIKSKPQKEGDTGSGAGGSGKQGVRTATPHTGASAGASGSGAGAGAAGPSGSSSGYSVKNGLGALEKKYINLNTLGSARKEVY